MEQRLNGTLGTRDRNYSRFVGETFTLRDGKSLVNSRNNFFTNTRIDGSRRCEGLLKYR